MSLFDAVLAEGARFERLPRRLRPHCVVSSTFAIALGHARVPVSYNDIPLPCFEIYDQWFMAGRPLAHLSMDIVIRLATDVYEEELKAWKASTKK